MYKIAMAFGFKISLHVRHELGLTEIHDLRHHQTQCESAKNRIEGDQKGGRQN
jgi:hypothetical protein